MKKMMMLLVMAGAVTACSGRNVVAVRTAPRMPRPVAVGVMGVAPGPGYVWVNGYQDWRGKRYVWVPGRWVRPPRANAAWVPGHFTTRGRSQVWVGGYWR